MQSFSDAIWVESLKARRSRLPGLTLLGFSLAPLVGGLFMKILLDPAWAHRFGILTVKAQATTTTADWPTYLGFLTQAVAVGGFIIFGVCVTWMFGREYSDRTAKDLLALPITRQTIVAAKFVVLVIWTGTLTLWVYCIGLGIGRLLGLSHWSTALAIHTTAQLLATAALTIILTVPLAWAASAGRGYLPPIGMMFLLMFLAQIFAVLGWGAYFPWSVPALLSGAAGPDAQALGIGSYCLVLVAGSLGLLGTMAWWRYADQI